MRFPSIPPSERFFFVFENENSKKPIMVMHLIRKRTRSILNTTTTNLSRLDHTMQLRATRECTQNTSMNIMIMITQLNSFTGMDLLWIVIVVAAGGFELGKPGKARSGQKFVLRLDALVLNNDAAAAKKSKNSKFIMAAPTFEALNTWMGALGSGGGGGGERREQSKSLHYNLVLRDVDSEIT